MSHRPCLQAVNRFETQQLRRPTSSAYSLIRCISPQLTPIFAANDRSSVAAEAPSASHRHIAARRPSAAFGVRIESLAANAGTTWRAASVSPGNGFGAEVLSGVSAYITLDAYQRTTRISIRRSQGTTSTGDGVGAKALIFTHIGATLRGR
jgi:hypothetical protein